MAYIRRLALSLLILGPACRGGEPGLGAPSNLPDTSTDTDDTTDTDDSTDDPTEADTDTDPQTGTEDDPDAWAQICDGSSGLRLAMVMGGGGTVQNEIEREIGFWYLYVTGRCEYFVRPVIDGVRWPDTHTGTLDESTEKALSQAVDYGGLSELAGEWATEGLADAGTLIVYNGTDHVWCSGGCEDGPAAAQALNETATEWTQRLWDQGEPYDGPLRISVVGYVDSTLDELGSPWPLSVDPWSLSVEPEAVFDAGHTVLIDNPEDVAILRQLRQQYRDDDLPEGTPNVLEAYGHLSFQQTDGLDQFQLWMRDALPLEDEMGLIDVPGL